MILSIKYSIEWMDNTWGNKLATVSTDRHHFGETHLCSMYKYSHVLTSHVILHNPRVSKKSKQQVLHVSYSHKYKIHTLVHSKKIAPHFVSFESHAYSLTKYQSFACWRAAQKAMNYLSLGRGSDRSLYVEYCRASRRHNFPRT